MNPFLPYDEDLWVAHLSATHTLLLNKFNLVAHHTLVVTREFEAQEAPLSAGDLAATRASMQARCCACFSSCKTLHEQADAAFTVPSVCQHWQRVSRTRALHAA